MLIAAGAASDGGAFDGARNDGRSSHGGNDWDFGGNRDNGDKHNFGDFNKHYDWLNPGGIYSYSWYPTYSYWNYPTYSYWNYPTYTYTYPTYTTPVYTYPAYTYTTPVYSTYAYDPVIYDPWYAANVYGFGGATYYYSSSWSWSSSHRSGFFF